MTAARAMTIPIFPAVSPKMRAVSGMAAASFTRGERMPTASAAVISAMKAFNVQTDDQ